MQRVHRIIHEHKPIHLSTSARKALFPKVVSLHPREFAGKRDPSSQGLHKLFASQKPAVPLASVACEVEALGVSVRSRCALAGRRRAVRTRYRPGRFRVAVRLFQQRLLPYGQIPRGEQL